MKIHGFEYTPHGPIGEQEFDQLRYDSHAAIRNHLTAVRDRAESDAHAAESRGDDAGHTVAVGRLGRIANAIDITTGQLAEAAVKLHSQEIPVHYDNVPAVRVPVSVDA